MLSTFQHSLRYPSLWGSPATFLLAATALIGTSVDQVTHGVALVDQSGQAFTRIAAKVSDIAGLAIVIARLGREQAEKDRRDILRAAQSGDPEEMKQVTDAIVERKRKAAGGDAMRAQMFDGEVKPRNPFAGRRRGGGGSWAARLRRLGLRARLKWRPSFTRACRSVRSRI